VFRGNIKRRVSLYADDLLLYISNPNVSLPIVLSVLHAFGLVSGYKFNLNKSKLFHLNAAARNYPLHTFSFRVVLMSWTNLTTFLRLILLLLTLVEKDFEQWSRLPLSLAGRIDLVKMNTLPK
jgi:hypothetical protein